MHFSTHLFRSLCKSALWLSLLSCQSPSLSSAEELPSSAAFCTGADISWLTEMEHEGHRFYSAAGQEEDLYPLLRSYGLDAVRLRVWVDPAAHGNWCNAQDLLAKALRARAYGFEVMVDFHYSDWWADPGKQHIPAAWANHTYEELLTDVAQHTREVLQLLKDHRVTPQWIQVGNETSDGMLWPAGKASLHPEQYAGLFKAGAEAAKAVFPDAAILVHLDNGPDFSLYEWNLDILKKYGAQWDMIGMSVYPYWSMQSGAYASADEVITKSVANIGRLYERYGCKVMVVETGMECADGQGKLAAPEVLQESQRQLLKLLTCCRDSTQGHCAGVFYWEPECKPGSYRLGAFTENGRPTQIMDAFKEADTVR